ncbi:MAG: phosphoglycerate kinase [Syntrophales bacterium]|jgi:phosphoglycerate kinase|nr:phosphoglycerate kinase [Syntrophales bacterium]MCK9527590.1 phosphoglycerate kinase [Syntrophales bacterium]MDX9922207.1 phosphoglycerate kinase [Syntrophales bacterium]
MKSIRDFDLSGKRVICRTDYNVPLGTNGEIVDDRRIRASLPTIRHALDRGSSLVIMTHLGRPKGTFVSGLSLAPVAKRLSELLGSDIPLLPDCVGDAARGRVNALKPGSAVLLENLRFHGGETKNDDAFARELAGHGDVYINDAFGNAHRSHASNVGILKYMKECGIGLLMEEELTYFDRTLKNPSRPFVAVLGGAKVSEKLQAIETLTERVDTMIIGGGMAFTFLKAMGIDVGRSLLEEGLVDTARRGIESARERGVRLYFPVDCVIARGIDSAAVTKIVPVQEIPAEWMALDIGPATTLLFKEALSDAKTVVWNGPMGVFELDPFSRGTYALARIIGELHALTIVGGGDTDVAVHNAGETERMTFISTGGGASLRLLEGKPLASIVALEACSSGRGEPSGTSR